ncbi:hypothetical protein FPOAC2_04538 [Fusarium poae]|jgi:hypothetical protein
MNTDFDLSASSRMEFKERESVLRRRQYSIPRHRRRGTYILDVHRAASSRTKWPVFVVRKEKKVAAVAVSIHMVEHQNEQVVTDNACQILEKDADALKTNR